MPRKTKLEVVGVNWNGLGVRLNVEDSAPTPPPQAPGPGADEDAIAAQLEAARIAALAEEEERRADAAWRELQELQRRRTQEAAAEREREERDERAAKQQQLLQEAAARRCHEAAVAAAAAAAAVAAAAAARDDDAPDETGWTPRQQRALETAMRANPLTMEKKARWDAIAAAVGRSAKECVARCRALTVAVKKSLPPPLLRLQYDALLRVCEFVARGRVEFAGGRDLCSLAATCKELTAVTHEDALWLPIAEALPNEYAYSKRDRSGERPWQYALRLRHGLYGSWHMLTEHRAGTEPYLAELGRFERGRFRPKGGALPYKIKYGAICELVQREAREQGGLNHRVYKSVADHLVALSANCKSRVPDELHMIVREIFKTCYPGYGAATGSGAYQPGLQAGGSSAKGYASGSMVGKAGVMIKKVQDEEMRKRLETVHEFLALVP